MRRKYIVFLGSSLVLLTSLFGCGGGGGGGSTSQPSSPPYIAALLFSFPTGSAQPTNFANTLVSVQTDSSSGAEITTANVIMNGVTLTYNSTRQEYEGSVTIMPGDSVALSVTVGGNTYTASGTQFSSYPTISVPVSGATWTARSANTVTWSGGAPLTNALYLLGVLDATDPNGGTAYFHAVQTDVTSYLIPMSSLTAGSRVVMVGIVTYVSIPNAATNSELIFGGFNYVPVTVIN